MTEVADGPPPTAGTVPPERRRRLINVDPTSTGNAFRRRRLEALKRMIERVVAEQGRCRIVDLGGTIGFWSIWGDLINWSRVSIICVNRDPSHYAEGTRRVEVVKGDVRNLSDFEDGAFDLAFSNSVIEHVGGWDDMEAMARETARVAPRYMVQTPNFWFPIEPHARTPLLHWIPEPLAYRVVMSRRCGFWGKQRTAAGATRKVRSARLIDARQMQELFPDAEIQRERFLGLTKSLVAVRDPR